MNTALLILKKYAGWVIAALVLCLSGYVIARTIAHSAIVAKERDDALKGKALADSLREAALTFAADEQEIADSATARAARDSARSVVTQVRLSRALEQLHIAQSIPIPVTATPSDSAAIYKGRYEKAVAALSDALQLNLTKDAEIAGHKTAKAALQAAVDSLTNQIATVERENAERLASVLKKMQPPCRLGFLPCPSRTVAFFGGVGATLAIVMSLR